MDLATSDTEHDEAEDEHSVGAAAAEIQLTSSSATLPVVYTEWGSHQPSCGRCHDFNVMTSHDTDCNEPVVKFIVCIKCQCLSVTLASYLTHVEHCLGLKEEAAPSYANLIVKFDDPPTIVVCDICGVFKQVAGAIMDAHREICTKFVFEHDGNRFPFVPADSAWNGEEPPPYFRRMLVRLGQSRAWAPIEYEHLERSGLTDCWARLPGRPRGGQTRCVVSSAASAPSATCSVRPADAESSSVTSGSAMSLATASDASRSSQVVLQVATAAIQHAVHSVAGSEQASAPAVRPREETSHIAHVAPQRQPHTASQARRQRRRRRSDQAARGQQQRNSTPNSRSGAPAGCSVGSVGRQPGRQSPHSAPRQQADARPGVAGDRRRRRRPLRNGGGGPGYGRVVDDLGDGALRVTSPRNDSAVGGDLAGAAGESSPRSHRSPSGPRRIYLEGAVVDHRTSLFIASVMVCGVPAVGTSAVQRRGEISGSTQISYYRDAADFEHLSQRTVSQARGQALLYDTSSRLPAGCLMFWDLPPPSGEWHLPVRDEARANPGANTIKLRFSPLRRG